MDTLDGNALAGLLDEVFGEGTLSRLSPHALDDFADATSPPSAARRAVSSTSTSSAGRGPIIRADSHMGMTARSGNSFSPNGPRSGCGRPRQPNYLACWRR
jgi:hypothetical protein